MKTTLTATPEFLALLPWAKSMAQASGAAELDIDHFRQAAVFCHMSGVVPLPEALYNALKQQMASFPAFKAQPEPVLHKMPLSSALKSNLGSNQGMGCFEWLNTLALSGEGEVDTDDGNGPHSSQSEPDTSDPEAASPAPVDAAGFSGDLGPGWDELKPWVHGAMRAHSVDELTVSALALGLLMALDADALDQHHGLAHWGRGHADELVFWLEQSNQYHKALEPVFTDNLVAPSADLLSALTRLDGETFAPTPLWRCLQSAVSEANRYSRLLQVAYHEAGHAVAVHLLVPESTMVRATIVPEGNAGGYVLRTFNEEFESVYRDSLEFLREQIVVSLAGRAAEEKGTAKAGLILAPMTIWPRPPSWRGQPSHQLGWMMCMALSI